MACRWPGPVMLGSLSALDLRSIPVSFLLAQGASLASSLEAIIDDGISEAHANSLCHKIWEALWVKVILCTHAYGMCTAHRLHREHTSELAQLSSHNLGVPISYYQCL